MLSQEAVLHVLRLWKVIGIHWDVASAMMIKSALKLYLAFVDDKSYRVKRRTRAREIRVIDWLEVHDWSASSGTCGAQTSCEMIVVHSVLGWSVCASCGSGLLPLLGHVHCGCADISSNGAVLPSARCSMVLRANLISAEAYNHNNVLQVQAALRISKRLYKTYVERRGCVPSR